LQAEHEQPRKSNAAPAAIANQIYAQATAPKMIAKCTVEGQSIDQAIAWATTELEGFSRS
jgi:hypothetical protein